jgi:hypothetical protein
VSSKNSNFEPSTVLVLGDYEHFLQGMLVKGLDYVGIRHTHVPNSNQEVAIFWNPWLLLDPISVIPNDLSIPVINGGGFHDSKINVANVFLQVFGYELTVDPIQFTGLIVSKSILNATHDGVTIEGPIAPNEIILGQTYQRLVNNSFGPSVVDIRVSIVNHIQESCYLKMRPLNLRYSNNNSASWFLPTNVCLTPQEIFQVEEFCRKIELDFGQLDICRDNGSGRIYIVDANNTPWGPPNGMSEFDSGEAIAALGKDFMRVYGLICDSKKGLG